MVLRNRLHRNVPCFLTLVFTTLISAEIGSVDFGFKIFDRVVKQCSLNGNKYSCLANRAAVAIERATKVNIPLFDGFTLTRNEEYVDNGTTPRSWSDGVTRLSSAVSKFLDSHTLTLDLTKEQPRAGGGGGRGIGGVVGKVVKKEKKYLYYALIVLLGVFGISGSLIMKGLSLIASKALIASKIALIIVGSIAMKKIFEKNHSHSTVKVHTHTVYDHHGDDYDRNINAGAYKFLKTF